MIIDAQVHIWAEDSPERPWVPGEAARAHRPVALSAEGALAEMRAAGVDGAVLVPPSWEGDRNDVVIAASTKYPDRFAAMGRIPIESPDAPELFAQLAAEPAIKGLRFTFHIPRMRAWLADGTADWLWPAAERAGQTLMVHIPGSLRLADEIVRAHPKLRLIIDHMGVERPNKDAEAFAHLGELIDLARHPNVAIKATGLPSYSTEDYPYRNIHPYIREAIEAFGPQRVFWGSDFTRLDGPYRQAVTLFTEEMPWLSDDAKAWIMGRAIKEWLNWRTAQ